MNLVKSRLKFTSEWPLRKETSRGGRMPALKAKRVIHNLYGILGGTAELSFVPFGAELFCFPFPVKFIKRKV